MQYLASDISLEGFSKVAGSTGDITDSDNLLVALAKLQNRTASATPTSAFARVPAQNGTLTYNGKAQEPVWSGYDANHVRRLSGSELKATDAGVYAVIFSLLDGVSWEDDGTFGDRIIQWTIEKAVISQIPSQSGTITYDGSDKSPKWNNYNPDSLLISGTTLAKDAGEYVAVFTPTKNFTWADGSSEAKTVTWTIGKALISIVPSFKGELAYTGEEQTPTWDNFDPAKLEINGITSAREIGTYTTTFTPKAGFAWLDGSIDTKEISWEIIKTDPDIVITPSFNGELIYDGKEQTPIWDNFDSTKIRISGSTSATEAGTYFAVFTPIEGYAWANGSTDAKKIEWNINKASVEIPSVAKTDFEYDGKFHVPVIDSYDTNLISVSGADTQTDADSYKIIFALKNSRNYQWSDNTVDNKEIEWRILVTNFYQNSNMLRSNPMLFGTDIFVLAG